MKNNAKDPNSPFRLKSTGPECLQLRHGKKIGFLFGLRPKPSALELFVEWKKNSKNFEKEILILHEFPRRDLSTANFY